MWKLILIVALLFSIWSIVGVYEPHPEVIDSLKSSESVDYVYEHGWMVFKSKKCYIEKRIGMIFLPGAKVDARSYASLCHGIVERANGTLDMCVLAQVPMNLAIFAKSLPSEIAKTYPYIQSWIIAGHSLGGAMGCEIVNDLHKENPDLWVAAETLAAYCPETSQVKILAFQGTNDGVQTMSEFQSHDFPNDATIVYIDGGNHSQMGAYGPQKGDGVANISMVEQHDIIIDETVEFLNTLV
jgi:hypothetical protein